MVTCTGHIGIHEGADGRTDVRSSSATNARGTTTRAEYKRRFV